MGCPSSVKLGNNLVFSITTHDPDTGVLTDADALPTYRVYENETGAAILNGTMAKLDDVNTTGFYTEQIACTVANGFEQTKTYTVYIEATVDGDTGGICYGFNMASMASWVLPVAVAQRFVQGNDIQIDAGDYMELSFSQLGDISGRQKLWFTVKDSKSEVDAASLIKIEETAGLEIINGTAATVAGNGAITVTDAVTGDITVTLEAEESVKLIEEEGKEYYDVKWVDAAGHELTLVRARALIVSDVTRETFA